MKRVIRLFAAFTLLGLPMVTSADETVIPPQMHWTATPPSRDSAEMARMSELLVNLLSKEGITAQGQVPLVKPFQEVQLGDDRTSLEERVLEYLSAP